MKQLWHMIERYYPLVVAAGRGLLLRCHSLDF